MERKIMTGVRNAVNNLLKNKKIPYACAISQNAYWEYIAKHKAEISMYLPVNYICMMHKGESEINISRLPPSFYYNIDKGAHVYII